MYVCTRAELENIVCDGGPGIWASPFLSCFIVPREGRCLGEEAMEFLGHH